MKNFPVRFFLLTLLTPSIFGVLYASSFLALWFYSGRGTNPSSGSLLIGLALGLIYLLGSTVWYVKKAGKTFYENFISEFLFTETLFGSTSTADMALRHESWLSKLRFVTRYEALPSEGQDCFKQLLRDDVNRDGNFYKLFEGTETLFKDVANSSRERFRNRTKIFNTQNKVLVFVRNPLTLTALSLAVIQLGLTAFLFSQPAPVVAEGVFIKEEQNLVTLQVSGETTPYQVTLLPENVKPWALGEKVTLYSDVDEISSESTQNNHAFLLLMLAITFSSAIPLGYATVLVLGRM